MSTIFWRKSSRCSADKPLCVEVARPLNTPSVMIRDSKNPEGKILGVPSRNFAQFVNALER